MPIRRSIALLAVGAVLAVGACGSSQPSSSPVSSSSPAASTSSPTAATSTAPGSAAPADTVWLCRPGIADNPCEGNLDSTSIDASGRSTTVRASPAVDPPIDCFYVYPTVSLQTTTNANLVIGPEERAVALAQAAQFSQVCRVYAPVYPQLTRAAIATPSQISLASVLVAYTSVASAFDDYLAHDNHGRGIVFIGHSQGAILLKTLLRTKVDANPATRRLLVSALLLGANVTVPVGKAVGGDFATIPACSTGTRTGCVVAYSSFDSIPPADALFGRTTSAFSRLEPQPSVPVQVLCVNPAAPGGGTAPLTPIFPTIGLTTVFGSASATQGVTTPFVTFPARYAARCITSSGATWLQIDPIGGGSDARPPLRLERAPAWGLHVVDVNIALGNLVALVRSQAAAYH